MKKNITVVGSINFDITAYVTAFPRINQTVKAKSAGLAVGGKGLNQAVASACAGGSVTMVGCVGDDSFGKTALEYLQKNAVETVLIETIASEKTGTANILVNEQSENMIAISAGANALLLPEHISAAENAIATSNILVTQLETPFAAVEAALSLAQKHGVRSILNPAPAAKECLDLLPLVDLVTPNETETQELTGIYPECQESCREAANVLKQKGVSDILITLGKNGCFVLSNNQCKIIPPYTVVAVDPTGAGDVFNGVLATFLAEGRDVFEAARFSSAAAALSVTKRAAEGAAPKRAEIDEFT